MNAPMQPVPSLDERNAYGFPVAIGQQARTQSAIEYAAQARARNKQPCTCESCKHNDMLPAVQAITEAWRRE